MSETHTMVFERTKDERWLGWIDAFPNTRVESTTKQEVKEALELLWAKLFTPKFFELLDPSEKTKPMAITLLGPDED